MTVLKQGDTGIWKKRKEKHEWVNVGGTQKDRCRQNRGKEKHWKKITTTRGRTAETKKTKLTVSIVIPTKLRNNTEYQNEKYNVFENSNKVNQTWSQSKNPKLKDPNLKTVTKFNEE